MKTNKPKNKTKTQNKSEEKLLNEVKASELPDTELKTIVIMLLKHLSDNFSSIKNDIEIIKKKV